MHKHLAKRLRHYLSKPTSTGAERVMVSKTGRILWTWLAKLFQLLVRHVRFDFELDADDELTRTTLYVVFIVFDPFTVQAKRKGPERLSISQIFSDPSSRRIKSSGKAFNQRRVK